MLPPPPPPIWEWEFNLIAISLGRLTCIIASKQEKKTCRNFITPPPIFTAPALLWVIKCAVSKSDVYDDDSIHLKWQKYNRWKMLGFLIKEVSQSHGF